MRYQCPKCKWVIAEWDKRRRNSPGALKAHSGAQLTITQGQAPRVRCVDCDTVLILVEGRLS